MMIEILMIVATSILLFSLLIWCVKEMGRSRKEYDEWNELTEERLAIIDDWLEDDPQLKRMCDEAARRKNEQ